MILAGRDAQRIILQFAALGGDGHRAFRRTSQARHAFGDRVDLFQEDIGDLVEQLMQRDEVRTLDVPMGMFRLCAEVDRIGQARVQQLYGL